MCFAAAVAATCSRPLLKSLTCFFHRLAAVSGGGGVVKEKRRSLHFQEADAVLFLFIFLFSDVTTGHRQHRKENLLPAQCIITISFYYLSAFSAAKRSMGEEDPGGERGSQRGYF